MLLQLGATGADVDALQQALLEAGIAATGEGSTFGPKTKIAVQQFQAKANLVPVDGIVGPKTWAAITGQDPSPAEIIPVPDYAAMTPLAAAALQLADGQWRKGVQELPGNRNRGPGVDDYLIGRDGRGTSLLCYATYADDPAIAPECGWCKANGHHPTPQCFGSPWCARFALWCYQGAALQLGIADPTRAMIPSSGGGAAKGAGDLAGAGKWIRWAKATGRLVGAGSLATAQPAAGDVMAISTPGHGHVMLCASVAGDKASTREGNASNRVNAHWRDIASITAWIRVG